MLEVRNLTKKYKAKGGITVIALDEVSLKFPENGMIFLLGKSGSGKSTLLNVIGGLDRPDSGEVIIKGKNSKSFSSADFDSYRNTYIGFIFQDYNILNEFNVEQNISLALQLQGKPNDKKIVESLLEQVDLAGYAKRKPNTLSGGQKQRVAIARALIKNPEIIMADEPTGALDSNTGKQVFETLKKLSKEKLVIVVSHDRDFAETYGDRIIELSDGKVISDVSKKQIEEKNSTENIHIINDSTIVIKNVSNLEKDDMNYLYATLKGKSGEIIITTGEKETALVKQTMHINENNASEVFSNTENVVLKEYDAKNTKFIRSRLPFSRAFKMGSSSLKLKPIRLIFTSFLTTVSLVMFGLTSALMLFNDNYSISRALKSSGRESEMVFKEYNYKNTSYRINNENGEIEKNYSYDTSTRTMLSKEDVDDLNNNSENMTFAGIYSFNGQRLLYAPAPTNDFYQVVNNFSGNSFPQGFVEINEQIAKDHRLNLIAGNYPSTATEIAIPTFIFEYVKNSYKEDVNDYNDILGKKLHLECRTNNAVDNLEFVISGVLDVGNIPAKYNVLKEDSLNTLSNNEKYQLQESLRDFLFYSYHTVLYVGPTFYDEVYYDIMGENDVYDDNNSNNLPVMNVNGFACSIGYYPAIGQADMLNFGQNFFTYESIFKQADYLNFFDLNNNKMSFKELNNNEIYVSQNEYNRILSSSYQNYFNKGSELINENTPYDQELRTLLNDNDTRTEYNDLINRLNDHYFNNYYPEGYNRDEDFRNIKLLIESYYEKTETLKRIYQTASEYINLFEKYHILTYEEYEAFRSYYYEFINLNDLTHSENVKQYLLEDRDGFVKLSKLYNSINNIYYENQVWASFVEKYESSETIEDSLISSVEALLKKRNSSFVASLDFDDITDQIEFVKYYYINKNREYGSFEIVGYYNLKSGGYVYFPIVSFEFLNENTYLPEYTTVTEYETQYVKNGICRYVGAIAKTSYSQKQIEILRKRSNSYYYSFSNNTYDRVKMILDLVSVLKTVFLITGIVFGSFAALMLLNFIASSISSKTKEIGILRAVGARGSDLFKIFFSESGLVTIICLAIAIVGSIFGCFFLNEYMIKEAGVAFLNFGIINIIMMTAGAIIILFLGTFFPVLIASKKPPVESIRAL